MEKGDHHVTRFRALPRSVQIIIGIVTLAILGCCGIAGLAAFLLFQAYRLHVA